MNKSSYLFHYVQPIRTKRSSLLGAKKLQGKHAFSFRTRRSWFSRTVNDVESSIAAYKVQCTPPAGTQGPPAGTQGLPAGTQGPPAGTQGFSSKLFDISADFNE